MYLGVEAALGWRAPWILMAGVQAAYLSLVVAARFLYPLPPDTVVAGCAFEGRWFGFAPPLGDGKVRSDSVGGG